MMKNKWVVTPGPLANADIKLLCFPYAGGGVHIYFPWRHSLPPNVELNIIQPPGRGTHLGQAPIDDMNALVGSLLPNVSQLLQGKYVVYGHSLGSRVAFELVRQAMLRGFPPPLHFFASGSASPKRKAIERKLYELPDAEFIAELKNMKGSPPQVLENEQLMAILLPTLRADFKMAENYSCRHNFTIPSPVTVLSGKEDKVAEEQLQMWGDFFVESDIVKCDGGHFFIDSHRQQVLDIVNRKLNEEVCLSA